MQRAMSWSIGLFTILLATELHAEVQGRLDLGGGQIDHPLGIATEVASPYVNASLALEITAPRANSAWQGSLLAHGVHFDAQPDLDYVSTALGVEWQQRVPRDRIALSAGVQGGLRRQQPVYELYDHTEVFAYLALKTYPRTSLMTRAYFGLRARTYGALPEENTLEPHLFAEFKHFSASRTTLGASLLLGGKWYTDASAPAVWGTSSTPSTAQAAFTLNAARGLGERVGVRGLVGYRAVLADFPYYVDEQVTDSPVLDAYARHGASLEAALKLLGPAQWWCELGARHQEDDFGAIRFSTVDGTSTRSDMVSTVFTTAERKIGGATLRSALAWRDQDSSIEFYRWRGLTLSSAVQLAW